ncbi:MAG: 4Fe-4S cluster-binding domain-containing protein [Candidatus Scalindua sp. AMX11]|nr:MAG: 4Fe-4S cluster-binding domain-containing protein [Candidatus Scalindua sp.]NOG85831.1 4Fe-4S cluster-binding domain-containing protein [Planctomycetota bacterium]RZV96996.1 MAG: 4Fe-4S cluster-binding domain-containing protein [Candidatus Scalindua sp. SCAELEC01]TDE66392.1 MAG: 4Fe-4S cluster-binding domain-containing protein [Candidatus Scalindua sp. AMX11]GJQ58217.1 MAG: radical SAM protein [Candidatus Scalindua sp.]
MEINDAIKSAYKSLESCNLCPRVCNVNRLKGEKGFCGIGSKAVVSSASPHFGEESVLVGNGGSGTIFFSGCNLGCVFCQNYEISQLHDGNLVEIDELAHIMLQLQTRGCININLVTPTHVIPHIIESIHYARIKGLTLPIVYNCGGYESIKSLKFLEGTVDIYMPDAKYMDHNASKRYSLAEDYPTILQAALIEMHRQVGDLEIQDGIATRGLLVRHLVMPNSVAKSQEIIDFLANKISKNTFVNIMEQYRPSFKANRFHEIDRIITFEELKKITRYVKEQGLRLST